MRYPYAAAAPLLAGMTNDDLAAILGCTARTVIRYKADGLPEDQADIIATYLGYHPTRIWPEFEAVGTAPCAECGTRFMPVRLSHRFCSPACQGRADKRRRYAHDVEYREAKKAAGRRYHAECGDYVREKKRRQYRQAKEAA